MEKKKFRSTANDVSPDEHVPLSPDCPADSVMKTNVHFLVVAGLWPSPGVRFYNVYTAITYSFAVANTIMTIFSILSNWGHMNELTLSLAAAFTHYGGVLKMGLLIANRQTYYRLVRMVDNLVSSQKGYVERDQTLAVLFEACQKKSRRLVVYSLTYLHVLGGIWYMVPFFTYPPGERLPFVLLPVKRSTDPALYAVTYVMQCLAIFYWIFGSIGIDCFFASVMLNVAIQIKILAHRITKLGMTDDVSGRPILVKSDENELHRHRAMEKDLNHCIETHQNILNFVKHLEKVMSPVSLFQFFFSMLATCVTLFQQTENPDMSTVLKCAGYLPTPAAQIFLYCWSAHSIMEEGEAISLAAYSCWWVDASASFKRSLRILMCRAQKPLNISAGRIYLINRSTFVRLLNASYSYYALLRQLNGR